MNKIWIIIKNAIDIITHISIDIFGLLMLFFSFKRFGIFDLTTIFLFVSYVMFTIYTILHFYELYTGKKVFNNKNDYVKQKKLSRADYLLMGRILLFCSLFFGFNLIGFFINQYKDLTYDETKFMELTYDSYDKIGAEIIINASEFEKPIYLSTIVYKFLRNDIDDLNQKQSGSKIEVYLIKSSKKQYKYEIIEIKFANEDAILTLRDYNKAHLENTKLGFILLPAFTVGSVMGCTLSFNKYYKMKKNSMW